MDVVLFYESIFFFLISFRFHTLAFRTESSCFIFYFYLFIYFFIFIFFVALVCEGGNAFKIVFPLSEERCIFK